MRRRDTLMDNRLLRRLSIRQRVLALSVFSAVVVLLPLLFGLVGYNRLLDEQQATNLASVEVDRALLMASARIASSRTQLLRYLWGEFATPERALDDLSEAFAYLDVARDRVDPARRAQIDVLTRELDDYEALVNQIQAARAGGAEDEALRLESQALAAGDALFVRIEEAVDPSSDFLVSVGQERQQSAGQRLLWVIAVEGIAVVAVLAAAFITSQSITGPVEVLREGTQRLGSGRQEVALAETGQDELSVLTQSYNEMATRLARVHQDFEQAISDGKSRAQRHDEHVETLVSVSQVTRDILGPDVLMHRAVEVIRQHLGLYYVGLFLVDKSCDSIVLRAGTGEQGQKQLSRGHQLAFGQGMIGWCVANERARFSSRAADDVIRVVNPDLPDTRSEAAIPLRVRGQVIGALTLQADVLGAFSEEGDELLQVMADLLAFAIENIRLSGEMRTSLDASQRAFGQMTHQGWMRVLQDKVQGYALNARGVLKSVDGAWSDDLVEVLSSRQMVQHGGKLAVPIVARDMVLGALRLEKAGSAWTSREIGLVQTVVEQLGIALDSARLYETTQLRAARETMTREVTDHMRATVDWDDLMQTAVQEIGQAVHASRIFVQWLPPDGEASDFSLRGERSRKVGLGLTGAEGQAVSREQQQIPEGKDTVLDQDKAEKKVETG